MLASDTVPAHALAPGSRSATSDLRTAAAHACRGSTRGSCGWIRLLSSVSREITNILQSVRACVGKGRRAAGRAAGGA
jgi:hypothetical protein